MVHLKCIHKGFTMKRGIVRLLLSILDPEGVAKRRARRRLTHIFLKIHISTDIKSAELFAFLVIIVSCIFLEIQLKT